MKKTLFSLVMVAVLLLTACGGRRLPRPAASSGSPVQITYMEWGDPAELDVWKAIVSDFEAANPGIKVNVDVSDWDSYWTKLKTLLAANTPPDVFAMDAPLYPDYQSRGVLLNLQPYIDKNPGMLDGLFPNTLTGLSRPRTATSACRAISRPSSSSITRTCSTRPVCPTRKPAGPMTTCAPLPRP